MQIWHRLGVLVLALALLAPAARGEEKELIAVLELQGVQANEAETYALTDRLREELLRSGRFTLVDRSQMEAVLNEQALQQAGCTEAECAVQVGRILGVRKIVTGKVIKISDTIWLVSGMMVNVESAETQRAESVQHRGDFFDLMGTGIAELAAKLAAPAASPASRDGITVEVTYADNGVYVGSNSFTAYIDDVEIKQAAEGLLYRGELTAGTHTFRFVSTVLGTTKEQTDTFYTAPGRPVSIHITRWAAGVAGGYNVHLNGELLLTRLF